MSRRYIGILVLGALAFGGVGALSKAKAQYASGQQSWSMGYGFPSATQTSVKNSAADLQKKAESGYYRPATTLVTNIYNTDNRQNYVENNAKGGAKVKMDNMFGDDIGQNTNVIGAMNTGQTTVDVKGRNNSVDAVNAADSKGCLDGSVNTSTSRNGRRPAADLALAGGSAAVANAALLDAIARASAGGSQTGCR